MSRDFRLIYLQHFDEETHANLVVSNEIYQPQASVIGERFEEKGDAIFFVSHAVFIYRLGGLVITILTAPEFLFHGLIYV